MHNITLICTCHSEIGQCNADELYKIIEQIKPCVIFEEVTPKLYDILYNKNLLSDLVPLEIMCIKNYKQQYGIKNIPVDIEVASTLSNSVNRMLALFGNYDILKEIEIEQKKKIKLGGFDFLNSLEYSELVKKQRNIEENIVVEQNDKQLKRIYKSFYEDQDLRESYMLENIYTYSNENNYENAVFLIGAAHRSSIVSKILAYQLNENVQLNWSYYGLL